ncbi:MAG TPA: group II intron reverse transcriptase/maturase [Candidatus Bathyarchaeia archaeon]
MSKAKPFSISKQVVWDAFKRVKANGGAAGVDGESIAEFESDLKGNLFKLWNRMSSGSYFPPPVRTVEIPKDSGGTRRLGIPTVSDRIAQMVVKLYLEPEVEPHFHQDSYGYRLGKSAIEAVGVARQRCWRYDWVVDLDIKGFFDNLDHGLVMRAVRKHTDCKWILLYSERWLKAPAQMADGTLVDRDKGTPQGGVASPLLANLFLHYAFDEWMKSNHPTLPFERYADDAIVHCSSERQAKWLKAQIGKRLVQCKLELHPEKTKIVYCKDDKRRGNYPHETFVFLGYLFAPRKARSQYGQCFVGFGPAVSGQAAQKMRKEMKSWRFHRRSDKSLEDLSRISNSILRGWINYYGRYYKSALYRIFTVLNRILTRWVMRKYKRFKFHQRQATHWLRRIARQQPWLFAHWEKGIRP